MKKHNSRRRNARRLFTTSAIVLVVLVAACMAIYILLNREPKYTVINAAGEEVSLTASEMKEALDVDTFYPGISINGVDVSGKTKEETALLFAQDPSLNTPTVSVILSVQGQNYPLDVSRIGISSNLSEMIDEAYSYGRTSTLTEETEALVERYNTVQLLTASPKNFASSYTADGALLSSAVHEILDPLESDVKEAKATSFDTGSLTFAIEESTQGISFDADKAVSDIQAALTAKEYQKTITVDAKITEPETTKAELEDLLGLVSSTTTTTTADPNRNTNIRLVCEKLDGLVLQPGESFNFNDYVGERTAAKGYKEAGGIFDGTLRQELGGGICQANGTLFHSVMKADLQVDERYPHSWPSSYVPVGTDATVTWGGVNFQFTNNTDFPVAIHAYYASQKVTVQIFGRPVADGMTIKIEGVTKSETPPGPTEYVADPLQPVGVTTVIRKPHNKIIAECYKVYYKDGVEVKRVLAATSNYRAITEKIGVGCLGPDGVTVYTVDPTTGVVNIPAATPAPTETTPAVTVPAV